MFNKENLKSATDEKDRGTATQSTRKGSSRRRTEDEESELMDNLGNSVMAATRRDSLIGAKLDSLVPNPLNHRFGQPNLLENLESLQSAITRLKAAEGIDHVPTLQELETKGETFPTLTPAGRALYENCAELANTFLENNGHADTPIKVFPAQAGAHRVKTGHRRYIAYQLVHPITGVEVIDVLVDKGVNAGADEISATISGITENTAREGNTLAEYLFALQPIVKASKKRDGKGPNKAKLSRQTGIERTSLGRMIDIIEKGAADDEQVLLSLHDHRIEDITSAQILFSKPRAEWLSLIDELASIGPTQFRAKHRELVAGEAKTLDNKAGEGASDPSSTPKKAATKGEGKGTASKTPAERIDRRNRGAKILMTYLSQNAKTLVDDLPAGGTPYEQLEALLDRLSEKQ